MAETRQQENKTDSLRYHRIEGYQKGLFYQRTRTVGISLVIEQLQF